MAPAKRQGNDRQPRAITSNLRARQGEKVNDNEKQADAHLERSHQAGPGTDLKELLDKMVADGRVEKRIINGVEEYRAISFKM